LLFAIPLLLVCAQARATNVQLSCLPTELPPVQGSERFFRIGFSDGGKATLEVASQTVDFVDITGGARVRNAHLDSNDIHAFASWGEDDASVSLLFAGEGNWKGIVSFGRDESAGGLAFQAGTEIEVRCTELR